MCCRNRKTKNNQTAEGDVMKVKVVTALLLGALVMSMAGCSSRTAQSQDSGSYKQEVVAGAQATAQTQKEETLADNTQNKSGNSSGTATGSANTNGSKTGSQSSNGSANQNANSSSNTNAQTNGSGSSNNNAAANAQKSGESDGSGSEKSTETTNGNSSNKSSSNDSGSNSSNSGSNSSNNSSSNSSSKNKGSDSASTAVSVDPNTDKGSGLVLNLSGPIKERTITTEYFTVTVPESWVGKVGYEINYTDSVHYSLDFYNYHDATDDDDMYGWLASISLQDPREHLANHMKKYGSVQIDGNNYDIIRYYPSDVRTSGMDDAMENSELNKDMDKLKVTVDTSSASASTATSKTDNDNTKEFGYEDTDRGRGIVLNLTGPIDSRTIHTQRFDLVVPKSWVGKVGYEIAYQDDIHYAISFYNYHDATDDDNMYGWIATISLKDPARLVNHMEDIGDMTIDGKDYQIVLYYPSDVRTEGEDDLEENTRLTEDMLTDIYAKPITDDSDTDATKTDSSATAATESASTAMTSSDLESSAAEATTNDAADENSGTADTTEAE